MLRTLSVIAQVVPSLISATDAKDIADRLLPVQAEETDPLGALFGIRELLLVSPTDETRFVISVRDFT